MPAHGSVNWFNIRTPDRAATLAFCGALFGWRFEEFTPSEAVAGATVWRDGEEIGLITDAPEPGGSPTTVLYVQVDDLRGTVERARDLGAKVLVEPVFVDDETGAFADLADPAGVTIGVWSIGL
ncbi:VOC family protein [Micromonospora sp. NPDC007271]|uniref:VOC family protein n=1 Tax=Micromonospora sp. NPDC007271 TaxID=3154587 RepID=UPI0033E7712F